MRASEWTSRIQVLTTEKKILRKKKKKKNKRLYVGKSWAEVGRFTPSG